MRLLMMGLMLAATTLTACVSRETRLANWSAQCERDYGFTPGTDAMARCVMDLDSRREQMLDSIMADSATTAAPAPMPLYVTPPR